MQRISKIGIPLTLLLAAAAMAGVGAACSDDVEMPRAYIALSADTIKAPAIASAYPFDIDANCDWTIAAEGDAAPWLAISQREATGAASVTVTLADNNSVEARSATLVVSNRAGTAIARLALVQNAGHADGYLPASEVRALAADGSYTFTAPAKMRAIVVSDQRNGNYPAGCTAVVTSLEPGNGITLRTAAPLLYATGDEVDVDLLGATVATAGATGFLELAPADDAKVSRTASSTSTPKPVAVTAAELASGDYDAMPVRLSCQVVFSDLARSEVSPTLTLLEPEGGTATMTVLSTCSFANIAVPAGSGTVTGICARYAGGYCIMPRTQADLVLDSQRYDGGITLPYIFSFMTENANMVGRYCDYFADASDINKGCLVAKDGTGATFILNLSKSSQYFNYWTDTSGHHNIQLGTWTDGPSNSITYVFPLGQDLGSSLRLHFGLGAQRNAPAHWSILYSNDAATWHAATDGPTVSLPIGSGNQYEYGGGKNYFPFTVDIKDLKVQFHRKDNLYIMLRPYDKTSISGGALSGSYGRACMHSCVAVENIPAFATATPAGAVYFEPFDSNTEGIDFRYGDKVCAMLNHCGSELAEWPAAGGLTGVNVRQRPGYAQIGYVETVLTAHTAYVNQVGELVTPALGAAGNLKLTFKAMAYRNWASFDVASKPALDRFGDARTAVVELLGGGTINGASSAKITLMDYSNFKNYEFAIEGANAQTQLKFTSQPAEGEFSRWFIDDICVTK